MRLAESQPHASFTTMTRPLWQLLIAAQQTDNPQPLTCAECFTIFEYLSELIVDEPEQKVVRDLLQQHQSVCPNCRTYYVQKLAEWEQALEGNTPTNE